VYPVSLLPLLVCAENGMPLFVMFWVAGSFAIYAFRTFSRRWKQFLLAFLTAAILSVMFIAFRLLHLAGGSIGQTLLMLFVGSMLTVAGYPLTFLFERVFNLISDARLEELCVTSNKIILELEQKAPGTFQHSLQVMNMSDAAARSIGANPLLVRAGALYHDIGKMLNPQCFIENESLMGGEDKGRYHSGLTPLQSSRDITRHVTDGAELADRYGLPSVLKDFILTHHGTTLTSFFYDKHVKEGGDPADKELFRYKGRKPFTKEQLILMVADSIEAASRTLKDYDQESLNALVEDIVARKVDEGQLDEAPVTMKELSTLKEAFCGYLGQMFHERIAYPNRQKIK
ncbi:MAG: HDIG domain-containing protein, partial [Bacteroidales bacterium]|nr:HDIG domain-containing protein [Bacteroidales bacterium]